jgi:Arc/MetJ-type ribon-helix-helix transcriptional regulator
VKLSVSLSEDDVALLDAYVRERGLPSRSAALQRAVRLLRHRRLDEEYAVAIDEWSGLEDAALWERTAGDGL